MARRGQQAYDEERSLWAGPVLRVLAVLVLAAAVGALVAWTLTDWLVTPLYTAEARLFVSEEPSEGSGGESSASEGGDLASSCAVMIESDDLLVYVATQTEFPYVVDTLREAIEVEPGASQDELLVRVTLSNAEEAASVANTVVRVAVDRLPGMLAGASATVVAEAEVPQVPSSPDMLVAVCTGAVAGAFFGGTALAAAALLDNRVHGASTLRRISSLPVLARIPVPRLLAGAEGSDAPGGPSLRCRPDGADCTTQLTGEADEFTRAFRLLSVNLESALPLRDRRAAARMVGVTSSVHGEGKTCTAVNLAIVLGQSGYRTLLIDADIHAPRVAPLLSLAAAPGLSDVLVGSVDLRNPLQYVPGADRLFALVAGRPVSRPASLLRGDRVKAVMRAYAQAFDVIIVNLPPVVPATDELLFSRMTDGVLVVAQRGKSKNEDVRETLEKLELAHAPVLGFVLTCAAVSSRASSLSSTDAE